MILYPLINGSPLGARMNTHASLFLVLYLYKDAWNNIHIQLVISVRNVMTPLHVTMP